MKVLFDTNVVLDHLLEREPHADNAERLLNLVDTGRIDGIICSTTATTIHYRMPSCMRRPATLARPRS